MTVEDTVAPHRSLSDAVPPAPGGDRMGQAPLSPGALAQLVGSRICHDLISPVGAIGNGLELLAMAGGRTMPGGSAELELISDSVVQANARIRFFRERKSWKAMAKGYAALDSERAQELFGAACKSGEQNSHRPQARCAALVWERLGSPCLLSLVLLLRLATPHLRGWRYDIINAREGKGGRHRLAIAV